MRLDGSCHCGSVRFSVESTHPVPYQLCYCSICRKTQGGAGAAINLSAEAATLEVTGREHARIYHARLRSSDGSTEVSDAERVFCGLCGSALWLFSPDWPELLHPFASAIDTDLPTPPERTHIMLDFKPDWVAVAAGPHDRRCEQFPTESIADWHRRVMDWSTAEARSRSGSRSPGPNDA